MMNFNTAGVVSHSIGQAGHQVLLDLRVFGWRQSSLPAEAAKRRNHPGPGDHAEHEFVGPVIPLKNQSGTALAHVPLGKRRRVENTRISCGVPR